MKRIFLIGYMGSGKTTYGRLLAKAEGLEFIDTDLFIENRFHQTVGKIFELKGEAFFRELERQILEEVAAYEDVVIATGGGMPCYADNIDLMNEAGMTIYLDTPASMLLKHLQESHVDRPLLHGKSPEEMLTTITEMLMQRRPFYQKARYRVNAAEGEVMPQLQALLH